MSQYRRLYVPGGTVFFTVVLRDRQRRLLVERIDDFRAAYRVALAALPVDTVAICILPDHLHCMWTLPPGDADYSTRWRLIKSAFSRALPRSADPSRGRRKGERGIWQRRFWERHIRDERDFGAHLGYIHWNPVKHGYVRAMDDWPYSSWHRFKRDYGVEHAPPPDDMNAGER